jgi:hypothetical protein
MKSIFSAFALLAAASSGAFAQVGVDGAIGAEWAGATSVLVPYPSSADQVAYRTYFRTDASYAYFAVSADATQGGSYSNAFNFSNIYIGTQATVNNSNVGMEITNNRFFVPGVFTGGPLNDGYYPAGALTSWANSGTGTIELAIPLSFFTSDPLAMGIGPATHVWFRSSQSFGYNLVTGSSVNPNFSPFIATTNPVTYARERFGIAEIPTPGAAALLGVGGLMATRRRRAV